MDDHRIEDLVEFPCDYLFKAFGPDGEAFHEAVRAAVSTVIPVSLDAVRVRSSSRSSYVCVSIVVQLHNAEQLRAIYKALQGVEGLRYLL